MEKQDILVSMTINHEFPGKASHCNTLFYLAHCSSLEDDLVQSLNSPFFPPHIGAETGRAKEESRITCMRMLGRNQSKIIRSQPQCSRQCVAQCLSQLALLRWLNRVMQDHEARASNLNRKFIFKATKT